MDISDKKCIVNLFGAQLNLMIIQVNYSLFKYSWSESNAEKSASY